MENKLTLADSQKMISETMDSLKHLLLEKNKRYGNSALQPIKMFSKLNGSESILVRLNDKATRVLNSTEIRKNDISDLIGYLALYCVSVGWNDFSEFID